MFCRTWPHGSRKPKKTAVRPLGKVVWNKTMDDDVSFDVALTTVSTSFWGLSHALRKYAPYILSVLPTINAFNRFRNDRIKPIIIASAPAEIRVLLAKSDDEAILDGTSRQRDEALSDVRRIIKDLEGYLYGYPENNPVKRKLQNAYL